MPSYDAFDIMFISQLTECVEVLYKPRMTNMWITCLWNETLRREVALQGIVGCWRGREHSYPNNV